MAKYRVTVPFACYVIVKVDAENEEEAIEAAMQEAYVTEYCWNGGCDKLIGVYGENMSIMAGEEITDYYDFQADAEEIN